MSSYRFSTDHHTHDAILMCIDFRFSQAVPALVREQFGAEAFDIIALAGAAKQIVDDPDGIAIEQLKLSKKLHDIKRIFLVNHYDCGAYGGNKAFSSWEAFRARHAEDLRKAVVIVTEAIPGIEVVPLIAEVKNGQIALTSAENSE
ncbi:MAG: hypothetical protein HY459_02640 [Parcubacteria group bacterium]|nr:hypothetical protein [Parcubacteria group bacterium]